MTSERNLWIQHSRENFVKQGRRSFPFVPGLFFLGLGVLVVVAPRLLIGAIAGLFLFIGAVFCFLAWKFMQLKRQLQTFTRDLEGKIQVQSYHVGGPEQDTVEIDSKKIVYH